MGVFNKIFAGLAPNTGRADQLVMMLPTPRRGERLLAQKNVVFVGLPDVKGGLNSKLHAVCDGLKEILSLVIICLKRIAKPQSRLFVSSG